MGYELLGEKIAIPSALVPGINDDKSLIFCIHGFIRE